MANRWVGYCVEGLKCKEDDVKYYDVRQEPFEIFGLWNPKETFHRIPDDVAKNASGAVFSHSIKAAGGRVRFKTNSPYIAIKMEHKTYGGAPHVTRLADVGADIYVDVDGVDTYSGSFYPPIDDDDVTVGIKKFDSEEEREITINMPIGIEVNNFEIGLKAGSTLNEHRPYKVKKPIVFYGSSITHGVAASRPGNTYECFISRWMDCDFINLGFSGSAMGETAMAEYIAGLDMTAFVLDYDHNAPDTEHLEKTHYSFYQIIREKNPDLPIVMISKPDSNLKEHSNNRRDVILNSYLTARKNGDKYVYFIDGYTFFPPEIRGDCTIDGCHPNDLGFYFMAQKISGVLKEIFNNNFGGNLK